MKTKKTTTKKSLCGESPEFLAKEKKFNADNDILLNGMLKTLSAMVPDLEKLAETNKKGYESLYAEAKLEETKKKMLDNLITIQQIEPTILFMKTFFNELQKASSKKKTKK